MKAQLANCERSGNSIRYKYMAGETSGQSQELVGTTIVTENESRVPRVLNET